MRRPISVQQSVAITLWCLATPAEYRTISQLCGVARSSVCEIVHETCRAIVNVLLKEYINFTETCNLSLMLMQPGCYPRNIITRIIGIHQTSYVNSRDPTSTTWPGFSLNVKVQGPIYKHAISNIHRIY